MRLMYTTALASAVLFAGPALAAGEKVEGTTGMTPPESSAAQLPGGDSATLRQDFESAGFQDWQEARDAQIWHMQTGDGQPVWVLLMPDGFQVGAAEPGAMESKPGDLAAAPGADVSEQSEAGDMPQRGEQADIGETFEGAEGGEQPDIAEAPELPGEADQQPDVAEAPELPREAGERPDVAEAPELPGEAGEQPDIAEAPEAGEPGIAGETEPEGFAAQIPGELRSDLESAGFQQIESVEGADFFHAKTQDGQTAFIILGELSEAGGGFGGQKPADLDQPGAAPGQPEPAPGGEQSPRLPQ